MIEFLTENWLIIITTIISVASVIAKVTPNQTDNLVVARMQKFVDTIALSSKPTEFNERPRKW